MARKAAPGRLLQRAIGAFARSALKTGARTAGRVIDKAAERRQPPPGAGDWISGQALGPAGVRRFHLFRPPGVRYNERLPLLVMLHGCGQDARSFALSTRMNQVARRERFFVLYPEQDRRANPQGCWNWYGTRYRQAQAEAATLLAAVDQVCLLYQVDRESVAVAGLSAGASMGALLATLYPTRFRAVAMHSGVPPGSARSAVSALAAMHGTASSPATVRSSAVWPPLLVIHGSADRVVAASNGQAAADMWTEAAGARAGKVRTVQRGERYRAQVRDFKLRGRTVATHCEVQGLGHAWSGGEARQAFSDERGPDASRMIWAFVARQLDPR